MSEIVNLICECELCATREIVPTEISYHNGYEVVDYNHGWNKLVIRGDDEELCKKFEISGFTGQFTPLLCLRCYERKRKGNQ